MRKFDVQIALEGLVEADRKWRAARKEYEAGRERVLARLIHEAARAFMSVSEFSKASGLSPHQVRNLMRRNKLNPSDGKRMLADSAAKALINNAELLGVKPHEIDLTSPLAYLPMGDELRSKLQEQTITQVTEIPEFLETERRCECEIPDPSGSLNGGGEVCMTCSYPIGQKCNVCRLNRTMVNGRCTSPHCPSNAEDRLARILCGADGMVNWTEAIPAKYRDLARAAIADGWQRA